METNELHFTEPTFFVCARFCTRYRYRLEAHVEDLIRSISVWFYEEEGFETDHGDGIEKPSLFFSSSFAHFFYFGSSSRTPH